MRLCERHGCEEAPAGAGLRVDRPSLRGLLAGHPPCAATQPAAAPDRGEAAGSRLGADCVGSAGGVSQTRGGAPAGGGAAPAGAGWPAVGGAAGLASPSVGNRCPSGRAGAGDAAAGPSCSPWPGDAFSAMVRRAATASAPSTTSSASSPVSAASAEATWPRSIEAPLCLVSQRRGGGSRASSAWAGLNALAVCRIRSSSSMWGRYTPEQDGMRSCRARSDEPSRRERVAVQQLGQRATPS